MPWNLGIPDMGAQYHYQGISSLGKGVAQGIKQAKDTGRFMKGIRLLEDEFRAANIIPQDMDLDDIAPNAWRGVLEGVGAMSDLMKARAYQTQAAAQKTKAENAAKAMNPDDIRFEGWDKPGEWPPVGWSYEDPKTGAIKTFSGFDSKGMPKITVTRPSSFKEMMNAMENDTFMGPAVDNADVDAAEDAEADTGSPQNPLQAGVAAAKTWLFGDKEEAAPQKMGWPAPGTMVDGMLYMGGDPRKQSSWTVAGPGAQDMTGAEIDNPMM